LITKIVGPSEDAKLLGKIKKEDSERHKLRLAFWTRFLELAKAKLPMFKGISPTKDTWIAARAGKKGFTYAYWVTKDSFRAELRIDLGKDSEEQNLEYFQQLKEFSNQIESDFGDKLEWNEAEGYRVCIVRKVLNMGGYRNPVQEWDNISEAGIDVMDRLEKATKPIITKLN